MNRSRIAGVTLPLFSVRTRRDWGIGQITDVSGFGALRRVKIRFPAAGEKTFVADKVKLKVVTRK